MLRTIGRVTTFRQAELLTTDPKVKVRVSKCSTCNAILPQADTRQHKEFHDDVRAVAKHIGLVR
jgi:hypothetical protein